MPGYSMVTNDNSNVVRLIMSKSPTYCDDLSSYTYFAEDEP